MINDPPLEVTTKCRRGHPHSLHGRHRADSKYLHCRLCHHMKHMEWAKAHPEQRRAIWEKSHAKNRRQVKHRKLIEAYGISIDQYEAMYEAQGGVCAICGGTNLKRELAVDHNHITGQVRALLCGSCNLYVSALESPVYPQLIQYLEKWNEH